MRQLHKAGEKLFVDYCGPTVDITNPDTGEIRTAQIIVGVLGASSYTWAEATWSQQLEPYRVCGRELSPGTQAARSFSLMEA